MARPRIVRKDPAVQLANMLRRWGPEHPSLVGPMMVLLRRHLRKKSAEVLTQAPSRA